MAFPIIEHISQIEEAIAGKPEFIIADRGNYKVVNYVYNSPDTFHHEDPLKQSLLRECRGLIFDQKGKLISRPFQKFFNIGEKEETLPQNLPPYNEAIVMEKLDGSMVRPLFVNGKLEFATKMGVTDIGAQALAWVRGLSRIAKEPYYDLMNFCNSMGYTPIFEWCSNDNRIVVSYPRSRLALTAIRNNIDGRYYNIDYYQKEMQIAMPIDINEFSKDAKDIEGYVARWPNGLMVKCKTDWYVSIHKSRSAITTPKALIDLIINERLDDLTPFLTFEDRLRVENFQRDFFEIVREMVGRIVIEYNWAKIAGGPKEYALSKKPFPEYSSIVFKMLRGQISNSNEEAIKALFSLGVEKFMQMMPSIPEWQGLMFVKED